MIVILGIMVSAFRVRKAYYVAYLPVRLVKASAIPLNCRVYGRPMFVRVGREFGFEVPVKCGNGEGLYVDFIGFQSLSQNFKSMILDRGEIIGSDGGKCNLLEGVREASILRGPSYVVVVGRQRLGRGFLKLYRRDVGCKVFDTVSGASLVDVKGDSYGVALLYRRFSTTYLLFDTIYSSFQVKLPAKPRKLVYSHGMVLTDYGDFASLITPYGVVDVPLSLEGFELIGVSPLNGAIYLWSRSEGRVYELDRFGVLEPVGVCRNVVVLASRDGFIAPLCLDTGEVFGGYALRHVDVLLRILRSDGGSSGGARVAVFLPLMLWVEDGFVKVLSLADSSNKAYLESVMDFDSVLVDWKVKSLPERLLASYTSFLIDSVDVESATLLQAGEGFTGFIVNDRIYTSLVLVWVRSCREIPASRLELCNSEGCVGALTVKRCGGCCYLAVFGVSGDISCSDLTVNVHGNVFRLGRCSAKNVVGVVNILKLRPVSKSQVLVEVALRLNGCSVFKVFNVDNVCSVKYYSVGSRGAIVRAYCQYRSGGFGGILGVVCRELPYALALPISKIVREDGLLGSVDAIELFPSGLHDYLAFSSDGGPVILGVDGVYDVLEGSIAIRLPWGSHTVELVGANGIKNISIYSPPPPRLQVEVVDRDVVKIGCEYECSVSCGSVVGSCTACTLRLRDVLSDNCRVTAYSLRGYRVFTSKDIIERVLPLFARSAALILHKLPQLR